jgi:GNAT superfamily N-acetyltransferase
MTEESHIVRDLGAGLALRRATAADVEPLVAFNASVHRHPAEPHLSEAVAIATRELMAGGHPTCTGGDFTLVEDTRGGGIVSSLCLIPQTWSYGGIPFRVGRPELVGTHPDYRRRGLVRAQFELVHEWSADRGHTLQAITGIPHFYRRFGYEMALELDGERVAYRANVPKLKGGAAEPYRVRPAAEADLPFVARRYERGMRRYLVTCVRNAALWQYELATQSLGSEERLQLRMVETAAGDPVGFLGHLSRLHRRCVLVALYEVDEGVSWSAVTPTVLRYLWTVGEEYAARDEEELDGVAFSGTEHPVYRVMSDHLPGARKPYAWYVRVPDLPGFLRHVAPVLERRLAESALAGHTGELKISFYRDGMRLVLEEGRLKAVDPWKPTGDDEGVAGFPGLTFLQLLLGYRTLEELDYAFADCWTRTGEARVLLDTLFPKQASLVWPVG